MADEQSPSNNQSTNQIAIIGPRNIISGFGVLGVKTLPVETKEDCAKLAEQLQSDNNYSIIFILEKWYPNFIDLMKKYSEAVTPAFVPIPDHSASDGTGLRSIKKIVERAVGSDIIG